MSLLVVKGNIVAALPMKGWYVCTVCMYEWVNISEPTSSVFTHWLHLYTYTV